MQPTSFKVGSFFTLVAALVLSACASTQSSPSVESSTASSGPMMGGASGGAPMMGSSSSGQGGMMGGTSGGGMMGGSSASHGGMMDKQTMCQMYERMRSARTQEEHQAMMNQVMPGISPDMQQRHMQMMEQQCK